MKKKILIGGLFVLALISIFAVSRMKDRSLKRPNLLYSLPKGIDSAYIENMAKLGIGVNKEAKMLTYIKERNYWKDNFNLVFMGDDEIKDFLEDNDFIMGPSTNFLNSVPIEAGNKILQNYNKILGFTLKEDSYRIWSFGRGEGRTHFINKSDLLINIDNINLTFLETSNLEDWLSKDLIKNLDINISGANLWCIKKETSFSKPSIMIIGAASNFNKEGMNLIDRILIKPTPKDPIAVIKVPNGYVELANWE